MATTLKTKNSVVTTVVPTTLAQGELAVNITDKKMWVGNAATTPVQILGAGVTNDAGGSNTQVQYNSSGVLAGSANMTFSGTALTLANDASISGLTVGKGGGAVASNTVVGYQALNATNTGGNNTGIGYQAGFANTTGTGLTAVGSLSGNSNTTGTWNTAIGYGSLQLNTTGVGNTGLGFIALQTNTTGAYNTAVGGRDVNGYAPLANNSTGSNNVSLGTASLANNTTGSNNTAVGYQALYTNAGAGQYNTAVGYQAGYSNSTGTLNATFGHQGGYSLTTGSNNSFFGGVDSGYNVTTGSKNSILGCYNGNQGGLDIRTSSNFIVLSDGDGNPRQIIDGSGNVLIGKTAVNSNAGGFEFRATNIGVFSRSGDAPLYVNRITNDGTLVLFGQDDTVEGNISVSGTTVSYNGGHLSRYAQTTSAKNDSLLKGTVLSNLDEMNQYFDVDGNPVPNEQLNKVKVSDVEGDVNVAGVFVNWSLDEQHNVDEINMAMTGDMIIRIAQGVVVAKGDLLMSAGDGTAKPQGDDIRRSKTVAKVTSNHVTCTYADGSYCVPCVLMAC
jgi:hypothetical protein